MFPSTLPALYYVALALKLTWASQVLKEFNFAMDAVAKQYPPPEY